MDVPFLVNNPNTEGVLRAFEAFCTDPQDNGYLALTECVIGTYPVSAVDSEDLIRFYQPTSSDAGGFKQSLPNSSLSITNLVPAVNQGDFPTVDTNPLNPLPTYSEGPFGVTLDSTQVPGSIIGTVVRDFSPGTNRATYARVSEGRQYRVRYHVTSTQQTNLNAQIRLRTRSIRFAWSQKLELGGSQAAGPQNNAIAAEALPGIGCQNPDKIGSENGGWYNVILHTPMSADIRPESGGTLANRMPNIAGQPGPGADADSRRDIRVGLDLLDSTSFGANSALEQGNVTLDRVEVYSSPLVDD